MLKLSGVYEKNKKTNRHYITVKILLHVKFINKIT